MNFASFKRKASSIFDTQPDARKIKREEIFTPLEDTDSDEEAAFESAEEGMEVSNAGQPKPLQHTAKTTESTDEDELEESENDRPVQLQHTTAIATALVEVTDEEDELEESDDEQPVTLQHTTAATEAIQVETSAQVTATTTSVHTTTVEETYSDEEEEMITHKPVEEISSDEEEIIIYNRKSPVYRPASPATIARPSTILDNIKKPRLIKKALKPVQRIARAPTPPPAASSSTTSDTILSSNLIRSLQSKPSVPPRRRSPTPTDSVSHADLLNQLDADSAANNINKNLTAGGAPKLKIRKAKAVWTEDETNAVVEGLAQVKGPFWANIKTLAGERLANRTSVNIKDKARTLVNQLKNRGVDVSVVEPYKFIEHPEP